MKLGKLISMRLLTHNMLTSHVKGVNNGYPLIIEASEVTENEVEFKADFICSMIPRIDWSALKKAMNWIGKSDLLPEEIADDYEKDEDFLKKVHHTIMEIEVVTGSLKCPESDRSFPINKGIPNMLLNEDEV